MQKKQNQESDHGDTWSRLAAALPEGVISWRQDGRPVKRDGHYFARFVAYVEASTVRERLDLVVPGAWSLTLDPLPQLQDDDEPVFAFKARLEVHGIAREDVGVGRDYKSAATDAFKRAAVRFGIAHELYSYERNWVEVDGDSRYALPLEDPATAYARRLGNPGVYEFDETSTPGTAMMADRKIRAIDEPDCPRCGGRMWDNRLTKRNPRAPDYRCRNRSCDGVIWPERPEESQSAA